MNHNEVNSNLEHLSLQDCIVDHVQWENKDLIFHFETIDVLPTHPDNPHDVAKCAEDATLRFKNCRVSNVLRCESSELEDAAGNAKPVDMSFEAFIIDFEVLEVKYQSSFDKKRIYKIFGQCAYEHDSDFAEFTVSFDSVEAEWSNLEEDSWFVGFDD